MPTAALIAALIVCVALGIVYPMTQHDWAAVGAALVVAWVLYKVMEYLDGDGY